MSAAPRIGLHRFDCPECGATLAAALRSVDVPAVVAVYESQTWLVGSSGFLPRDSPLWPAGLANATGLHGLVAPRDRAQIALHDDPARTIGCCGLSYGSLTDANLVCARCRAEVGVGYEDCCGPHWAAFFDRVVHTVEERLDPWPSDHVERAEVLRMVLDAAPAASPIPHLPSAADPRVYYFSPETWHHATRAEWCSLGLEGTVDHPVLVLRTPTLPDGLRVPTPLVVLMRLLVLEEVPYGTAECALPWRAQGDEDFDVNVAHDTGRVIFDLAARGTHLSFCLDEAVWSQAWASLRAATLGHVLRVVHEGRGGYLEIEGVRYPIEHVEGGRFAIHLPSGKRPARFAEHLAALERFVAADQSRWAIDRAQRRY